MVATVILLAVLGLVLGPQLGELLQSTANAVWPEVVERRLVQPEPTELGRFVFAVLAPMVVAGQVLFAGRGPRARRQGISLSAAGAVAALAGLAVVVVGWLARAESVETFGLAPDYFSSLALLVAAILAATVAVVALSERGRSHLARLHARSSAEVPLWSVGSVAIAALALGLTALYTAPGAYTSGGLDSAVPLTALHIPFTLADYAALGNGATPLTDFAGNYANLLPWALHPVLSAFDYSAASFTVAMALLTVACLLAMWRVLTLTVGSRLVGVVLFVPVLALSLRPTVEVGDERASNASLYQIMPERYLLPMVVAWLCVRHLGGRHPRSPYSLFFAAGIAVLNNPEFGGPCLLGVITALLLGSPEPPRRALPRLAAPLAAGVGAALVVVSAMTLLRTGSLPDPSLLTYFSRMFGSQGFGMQPMPAVGFHLILYVTFAGALILAAVRRSVGHPASVLTAMLGFSGMFGLGASTYYAGRSNPVSLVALFPAWGLCLALLSWAAVSWLVDLDDRRRLVTPIGLLALSSLVGLGLAATDLSGMPSPRTQVERLTSDTGAGAQERALEAAARFVDQRTAPGERVLFLRGNGHLVARAAGVRNVGSMNHSVHVISASQLDDEIRGLLDAGGTRIFTGSTQHMYPSLLARLRSSGWEPVARDLEADVIEWGQVAGSMAASISAMAAST